jgi:hypothetical protein
VKRGLIGRRWETFSLAMMMARARKRENGLRRTRVGTGFMLPRCPDPRLRRYRSRSGLSLGRKKRAIQEITYAVDQRTGLAPRLIREGITRYVAGGDRDVAGVLQEIGPRWKAILLNACHPSVALGVIIISRLFSRLLFSPAGEARGCRFKRLSSAPREGKPHCGGCTACGGRLA